MYRYTKCSLPIAALATMGAAAYAAKGGMESDTFRSLGGLTAVPSTSAREHHE